MVYVYGLEIHDSIAIGDVILLDVSLLDVLNVIGGGAELNWSIIELEAVWNPDAGESSISEEEILALPRGLRLSFDGLKTRASKIHQTLDAIFIGCKSSEDVVRYDNLNKMYAACDLVIEMVDSSLWEIHSYDESQIERLLAAFKDTERLYKYIRLDEAVPVPNIDSENNRREGCPNPHQHLYVASESDGALKRRSKALSMDKVRTEVYGVEIHGGVVMDDVEVLDVSLRDILNVIEGGAELNWSIIELEATWNPDAGEAYISEEEIAALPRGLSLSFDELKTRASKIDQAINTALIGCKPSENLARYEDCNKMYVACDLVIELIDGTSGRSTRMTKARSRNCSRRLRTQKDCWN